MDGLWVRRDDTDDWVGPRLRVSVAVRGMVGEVGAPALWQHLGSFIEACAVYPLANLRPVLDFGPVSLTAFTLASRGQLGVRVRLTRAREWSRRSVPDELSVVVPTSYEALQQFCRDLLHIAEGHLDETSLDVVEFLS